MRTGTCPACGGETRIGWTVEACPVCGWHASAPELRAFVDAATEATRAFAAVYVALFRRIADRLPTGRKR